MRFVWISFAAMAAAACSGGAHQVAIGPVPPTMTHASLVGPLCTGERCKCREVNAAGDGGAGAPAAGTKRFEIRIQSPQAAWATVRGEVLYKSAEQAEACFYLDMTPGRTPIELRGSNKDGVAAGWQIKELGAKVGSWYDTFSLDCGSHGVCSFDDLDAAKAEYAALKEGVHDACGSTRVRNLQWDTGHAPDALHPSELLVRATLQVYKFEPDLPHGDAGCGKLHRAVGGGSADAADATAPAPASP